MAQAAFTFTRRFEELPAYRLTAQGETFYGPLFDGEVTIECDTDRNWQFGEITIELDNLKLGKASKGHSVRLDPDADEHLYLMLMTALERDYATSIEAWMDHEIAACRPRYAA